MWHSDAKQLFEKILFVISNFLLQILKKEIYIICFVLIFLNLNNFPVNADSSVEFDRRDIGRSVMRKFLSGAPNGHAKDMRSEELELSQNERVSTSS